MSEPTPVTIEALSNDLHVKGTLYKSDQTATGGALDDTDYVPGGLGFRLHATLASGTNYLTMAARDGASTGGYIVRVRVDSEYQGFIDTCTGLSTSVTDPLYGCQWHLNNTGRNAGAAAGEDINVAEVWSGGNLGAEVNIAIVDDGIHAGHVDLTDNVDAARNHDYTGNGAALTPPHAHGTQMAGIVAARGNALGVRGVAPQAKVYGYNLALDPTLANMADAITREMATTPCPSTAGVLRTVPACILPARCGKRPSSRASPRASAATGSCTSSPPATGRSWVTTQPERVRQPPRRHRCLRGERPGRAGRLLGARRQPVGMRAIQRHSPERAPGNRNDGALRPLHQEAGGTGRQQRPWPGWRRWSARPTPP